MGWFNCTKCSRARFGDKGTPRAPPPPPPPRSPEPRLLLHTAPLNDRAHVACTPGAECRSGGRSPGAECRSGGRSPGADVAAVGAVPAQNVPLTCAQRGSGAGSRHSALKMSSHSHSPWLRPEHGPTYRAGGCRGAHVALRRRSGTPMWVWAKPLQAIAATPADAPQPSPSLIAAASTASVIEPEQPPAVRASAPAPTPPPAAAAAVAAAAPQSMASKPRRGSVAGAPAVKPR